MSIVRDYWRWLGERLRLSIAGRSAFSLVLMLAVAGAVADAVSDSPDGGQAGGVLLVFAAVVLTGIVCLDAAVRGLRSTTRRS